MLTIAVAASAQVTSVTGTVKSGDDGEPVVGATVAVKGTKAITVTDANGKFTISQVTGSDKTLVVRFIGMKTVEAALRPVMNIVMEPETTPRTCSAVRPQRVTGTATAFITGTCGSLSTR